MNELATMNLDICYGILPTIDLKPCPFCGKDVEIADVGVTLGVRCYSIHHPELGDKCVLDRFESSW